MPLNAGDGSLGMKVVKRVNPTTSHHKEKVFLSFSFILYLCEVMDVHCGDHFMMYVSQIMILYTLNLYSAICQLYLNKTGRRRKILVMGAP